MRIGFYGASEVAWTGYKINGVYSWNDMVCEYFKADQTNHAVLEGSSERALLKLKSTKDKLDLAVFSLRNCYKFAPMVYCDRDFPVATLKNDDMSRRWYNYVGTKKKKDGRDSVKKQFESEREFVNTWHLHKKHLWSPELQMIRHAGALIQINQYLSAFNIPTVFVVKKENLPAWVKLDSGVNSTKISKLYEENRQHDNLPNNLSAEGQKTIAKYFVSLVEKEKLI